MGKTPHQDWLISLQSLLTTVVIAIFVVTFIIQAFQIPSESMESTLLIGDYLLVDKLCYGGGRFLDHILPTAPCIAEILWFFTIRFTPANTS